MSTTRTAKRAGGRAARTAARAAPLDDAIKPVRPGMPGGQYRPLSDADCVRINEAALLALEEIGFKGATPSGREILTGAGATESEDGRIRFPRALVEDMLAKAARDITLFGRDPAFDMHLSGTKVHYGTAGAAVHMVDAHTGEYREPRAQDMYDAARIVQTLDNVHFYQRPLVCREFTDNLELDLNSLYAASAGTTKHIGVRSPRAQIRKKSLSLLTRLRAAKRRSASAPSFQTPIVSLCRP